MSGPLTTVEQRVDAIMKLKDRSCRWLEGDLLTGLSYCTQRAAPGKVYCEAHAARAYTKVSFKPKVAQPNGRFHSF